MASTREIEIKFRIADVRALGRKLRAVGFRLVTPRTHEINTLYDLPGELLRARKNCYASGNTALSGRSPINPAAGLVGTAADSSLKHQ